MFVSTLRTFDESFRDLQPEERVAVANATVARALRGYPQHFFYGSEGDARTTTNHSGFRAG